MHENNSTKWSIGALFVQWRINTLIVRSMGNKSPYELLTGQRPRRGISSLPIDKELLTSLKNEAQLNNLLGIPENAVIENYSYDSLTQQSIQNVRNNKKGYSQQIKIIQTDTLDPVNNEVNTIHDNDDNNLNYSNTTSKNHKSKTIDKYFPSSASKKTPKRHSSSHITSSSLDKNVNK